MVGKREEVGELEEVGRCKEKGWGDVYKKAGRSKKAGSHVEEVAVDHVPHWSEQTEGYHIHDIFFDQVSTV